MNKKVYFLLTISSIFILLFLAGCSMMASSKPSILSNKDWPKKRVMIMPVTDLSGIASRESRDAVSIRLTKIFQKTGYFNIHPHNTKKFRPFSPEESIDLNLLKEANERGINAIIFETLNPIELNAGRSGIWPFREKAFYCSVSIHIDIVDVSNNAKLFSKEIADNITLSSEETANAKDNDYHTETKKKALKKCLPGILKEAANAAIFSLNQNAWTGRIVSINKKEITINAGSDVDLRAGVALEVFSRGEYITSFNNETYQLPGKKVGEIKITTLETRYSLAEPIDGDGFQTGQIVRVKN
ncbi:MAG: hypothetical protein ACQEQO_03055 [Thermodesulfobacteriota bacterium]